MTPPLRSPWRRGLLLLAASLLGCGNDFDPVSKINSVRILATRADHPYARPGDTVQFDMLAVDGRAQQSAPMKLFWVPVPCINPPGNIAETCYPVLQALLPQKTDLTPLLAKGSTFSISIPPDVLEQTAASQSGTPYSSVFVFSMACAGHVEFTGIRSSNPQASPFTCFDDSGQALGSEDFVFAYSQVFVFADRTNENPTIEGVSVDGQPVDASTGLVVSRCSTPSKNGEDPTCPTHTVDVRVPATSQELDPSYLDSAGNPRREALWVSYYTTGGKVKNDVRVLFDPEAGRASSANDFEAPSTPGEATLWAVVHDNRGGVNWAELSVHTR